ncbi:MAG TPA: hypothetical protein VGB91_03915 [Rhizomicrobium sp.]
MFQHCAGQLRAGFDVVVLPDGGMKVFRVASGMDFGAMLALADSMGAKNSLFVDLLPEIEAIAVRGFNSAND